LNEDGLDSGEFGRISSTNVSVDALEEQHLLKRFESMDSRCDSLDSMDSDWEGSVPHTARTRSPRQDSKARNASKESKGLRKVSYINSSPDMKYRRPMRLQFLFAESADGDVRNAKVVLGNQAPHGVLAGLAAASTSLRSLGSVDEWRTTQQEDSPVAPLRSARQQKPNQQEYCSMVELREWQQQLAQHEHRISAAMADGGFAISQDMARCQEPYRPEADVGAGASSVASPNYMAAEMAMSGNKASRAELPIANVIPAKSSEAPVAAVVVPSDNHWLPAPADAAAGAAMPSSALIVGACDAKDLKVCDAADKSPARTATLHAEKAVELLAEFDRMLELEVQRCLERRDEVERQLVELYPDSGGGWSGSKDRMTRSKDPRPPRVEER